MVSRKKGFTLIELLAVIAIIGILAGFIFAAVSSSVERAKITKTQSTISNLSIALTNYERDNGSFDAKLENGQQMPTGILDESERAEVVRILTGKRADGRVDTQIREDPRWSGPYLEPKTKELSDKGALVDAWGHALMMRIKQGNYDKMMLHRPDSFETHSWGPNELDDEGKSSGKSRHGGKADDINNWD